MAVSSAIEDLRAELAFTARLQEVACRARQPRHRSNDASCRNRVCGVSEADEDKRHAMQRRACQAGLLGARTDLRRCVAMLMQFDPFREFDRLTEQWRSRQNPARYRSPKALTPRRSRLRPRRPARSRLSPSGPFRPNS